MKNVYILKILFLTAMLNIIVGCTTTQTPVEHWHGKNLHKVNPADQQ